MKVDVIRSDSGYIEKMGTINCVDSLEIDDRVRKLWRATLTKSSTKKGTPSVHNFISMLLTELRYNTLYFLEIIYEKSIVSVLA